MDSNFNFTFENGNSTEISDLFTSAGDFDFITQQIESVTDLDGWYEVENAEKVNHSFIKDGLKIKNHTQLSISDAIALFFTSNFFNIAFKYTNQNIIRKNETRKQKIKPVTFDEIKKYIAIYLYLGIAPVKIVKYL